MIEAILVHIPLQGISLDAPAEGIQDAAWRAAGAMLTARLRPWLDTGWDIVPGTLGPHSLRVRRLNAHRGAATRRFLPPFPRRRDGAGQRYEVSAACLLRRC